MESLTLSDLALNDLDRQDFERLRELMTIRTSRYEQRKGRRNHPTWRLKTLTRAAGSLACEACGQTLVIYKGRGHRPPNTATVCSLIELDDGAQRSGINTMLLCDICHRNRHGRDIVNWAEIAEQHPKRFRALLEKREHVLRLSINHPTRKNWKTKIPVLRELTARWANPRSAIFTAWRDQWDTGGAPASTLFRGWVMWPTHQPPSGLVRIILTTVGQATLVTETDIPSWEIYTITGGKMRDLVWTLIETNTWVRRFGLVELLDGMAKPAPPEPFDEASFREAIWRAAPDDFREFGLLFDGPRVTAGEAALTAAKSAYAAVEKQYEADLAKWRAWPPPPFARDAEDDWWRAFWSVGQCGRRRVTPERTGRFAPRRPGSRPPPARPRRFSE